MSPPPKKPPPGYNPDELTPVSGEALTTILMHTGATREAIIGMRTDLSDVKKDLRALRDTSVTRTECTQRYEAMTDTCKQRHDAVQEEVTDVSSQLEDVGKTLTEVSNDVRRLRISGEVKTTSKEASRKTIAFWLSLIVTVGGLLGTSAWGLIRLGGKMSELNATVSQTRGAVKDELQQLKDSPRVIYVTVPADAGVAREPARQPRPRRRRLHP